MAVTSATEAPAGAGESATAALPWAPLWARSAADTAVRLQDALSTRGATAVLQELFSLPEDKEGQRSRRSEDIAASHWLQKLGGLEHLSCGFLQQAPKQNLHSASSCAQEENEIDVTEDGRVCRKPSNKNSNTIKLGEKVSRGTPAVSAAPEKQGGSSSSRSSNGVTSPSGAFTPTPVPPLLLSQVLANQNYYSAGPVSHEETEPPASVTEESGEAAALDGDFFSVPAEDERTSVQVGLGADMVGYDAESGTHGQMKAHDETSSNQDLNKEEQMHADEETAVHCQRKICFYTEDTLPLETDDRGECQAAPVDTEVLRDTPAGSAEDSDVRIDAAAGTLEAGAERALNGRWKPTLESEWQLPSSAQAVLDPVWSELDSELRPKSLSLQVVACLESDAGAEKSAWLRTAGDDAPSRVDAKSRSWLQEFCTDDLHVAVCCRTGGGIGCIGQDSYSITRFVDGTTTYVVCDGHGTLGHLASFRIAQSLPKFIQEGLASSQVPENVIARAFMLANVDLFNFAAKHGLDFNMSGTTAAAALRQGDGVYVAWLGDTRALIASVADGASSVDLMSPVHAVSMESEMQRMLAKGAEIRKSRVYAPEAAQAAGPLSTPAGGLTVSRALGDYSMSPHGVIGHPDLTKTSFAAVPGLVLLASGGLCEHLSDDETDPLHDSGEVLLELLTGEGKLLEAGPHHALTYLCDVAREVWQEESVRGEVREDMTGLLIQWVDKATLAHAEGLPVTYGPPPAPPPQQVQETLAAGSPTSCKPPAPSGNCAASQMQVVQDTGPAPCLKTVEHLEELDAAQTTQMLAESAFATLGPSSMQLARPLSMASTVSSPERSLMLQLRQNSVESLVLVSPAQSAQDRGACGAWQAVAASSRGQSIEGPVLLQSAAQSHCTLSQALVEGPRLPEGPRITRHPSYDR